MTTQPMESDIRVDVTAIEKSLSELWRGEKKEGDHAVTRAALRSGDVSTAVIVTNPMRGSFRSPDM